MTMQLKDGNLACLHWTGRLQVTDGGQDGTQSTRCCEADQ
jgi:hypothetical protein